MSEFGNSETTLREAAQSHVAGGDEAKLYPVRDSGTYTGAVMAIKDGFALQRLRDSNSFTAHDLKKLAGQEVQVGQSYTMRYKDGKVAVSEPVATIDRQPRPPGQAAPQQSPQQAGQGVRHDEAYFQMRGSLMKQFGQGIKVYEAKTDIGRYNGAIVSIAPQRVAQQINATSFVVHDKERLAGQFQRGALVDIAYKDGRAISTLAPQAREQRAEQPNRQFPTQARPPASTAAPGVERAAPRREQVDQAAMHAAIALSLAKNVEHLKTFPNLKRAPADQVAQLAYFRGVVEQNSKALSTDLQKEQLDKFDALAQDKESVRQLLQKPLAEVKRDAAAERTAHESQERADEGASL
jgi:hypothetical protein